MYVGIQTIILWVPEPHPTLETECWSHHSLNPTCTYGSQDWIDDHTDCYAEFAQEVLKGKAAGVYSIIGIWLLSSYTDAYTGEYDSSAEPLGGVYINKLPVEAVCDMALAEELELSPEEILFLTGQYPIKVTEHFVFCP